MDDPDILSTAALSAKATWLFLYLALPCLVVLVAIFVRYVRFTLREIGWVLRTALVLTDLSLAIGAFILVGQNLFHWSWLFVWSLWLLPVAAGMLLVSLIMKLWITFRDRGGAGVALVPPAVGLLLWALRWLVAR